MAGTKRRTGIGHNDVTVVAYFEIIDMLLKPFNCCQKLTCGFYGCFLSTSFQFNKKEASMRIAILNTPITFFRFNLCNPFFTIDLY